jgi:fructose-bisphosphate aldolase class II
MLVGMKEILVKARKEGYGVGAFNVYNLETAEVLFDAFNETRSPGIFLAGGPAITEIAAIIKSLSKKYAHIPVAIILDHGRDYETTVRAVRAGFTDVMIDASAQPFEENVRITKEVARMAHAAGCGCEAELGHVGQGATDDASEREKNFTRPDECKRFVKETGVDFLAVAIGTAHGLYKTGSPTLNLERLKELVNSVDIPLVLHGGSDTPLEQIQAAIKIGIEKINIGTDIRVAYLKGLKEAIAANPNAIDPRVFTKAAKERMKEMAIMKIRAFGSDNRI